MKRNFKKISLIGLFFCALGVSAAPEMVFETTFRQDAAGAVLDNTDPAVKGKLGPGTRITDTPAGKALLTSGVINNGVVFPAVSKLELGNDFSYSGWVLVKKFPGKDAEKPYRSQTFMNRAGSWRIDLPQSSAGFQTWIDKELYSLRCASGLYNESDWVHIAFVYSVAEKRYELFVNGVLRASKRKSTIPKHLPPVPSPCKSPLQIGSLGNYFPLNGAIGRFRAYNGLLTSETINITEQDIARKIASSVKNEISGVPGGEALVKRIAETEKLKIFPLAVIGGIQKEKNRILKFASFRQNLKGANEYLAYSVVDPLAVTVYYSDSALPADGMNGELLVAAAQNEFEPASFIVKPLRDIKDFKPVIEPLKSKSGDVINPSAIDIRLVKEFVSAERMLRPNVLIHDDALLKVDREKLETSIRLSFKDGIKYYSISQAKPDNLHRKKMTAANFPIYDAKSIQALDLKAGLNQQYWLTLRTDSSMKPGLYTSKVRLMSGGKETVVIPLKVRILPFLLPEPKTNYDISREFSTGVYFFDDASSGTEKDGAGAINHTMPLNEAQFKAYLANLYNHGIRHPTIIMGNYFPGWDPWKTRKPRIDSGAGIEKLKENMKRRLGLLKEAGFALKPLYLHTGGNIGFREFYNRAEHKEMLRDFIKRGNAFYKSIIGHDDIYHYGLDEAEGERLAKEFEVWEDMREMGAKIYTTIKAANTKIVSGKINIAVAVHNPDKANSKLMHDNGGRLWSYAQPFAKQMNGYAHRKGYGYGVYFADYDGICNYSFNHWDWRTIPWSMYNSAAPNLSYTMPSADGVIDTPGWEGYREGIDDVRYATLLRRKIAENIKSPEPRLRSKAAEAKRFMDSVNKDSAEFDSYWTRMRITDFILDLTEK